MRHRAKIVVFEGPDKVGKETQPRLCAEALQRAGARVVRVEAPHPQAGLTYQLIYWMLRTGWAKRLPHVFQFVQFVNKLVFQLRYLPSLERHNDVLVFDRWGLSAVVYGAATGVNRSFNMCLYRLIRKADLTIVFVERSYRRSSTEDDSYERDNDLQGRVRDLYRRWALDHASDHVLIRNDRPVDGVHRSVMDAVCPPCRTCGAVFGEPCDAGLHS